MSISRQPEDIVPGPLTTAPNEGLPGSSHNLSDLGDAAERLAAIVESSDDAIIGKNLDGIIISWNKGAEQLFGYAAHEIIGKSITTLIPEDRHDEEPGILERIRRGERIAHYETIRQRKDRSLVEISLTVSPIRDAQGKIIGASKISRDISERKRAEETRELLLNEIQHRVKNTLGLVQAIATQTFRVAPSSERQAFGARIQALAAAYDLLTHQNWDRALVADVVDRALSPFRERGRERFHCAGPEISLNSNKALLLSMVIHELGTNAVKFGALSVEDGRVEVVWDLIEEDSAKRLDFRWRETGGPSVAPPTRKGFGTTLIERAVENERGNARVEFAPSGVTCTLAMTI